MHISQITKEVSQATAKKKIVRYDVYVYKSNHKRGSLEDLPPHNSAEQGNYAPSSVQLGRLFQFENHHSVVAREKS